MRFMVDSGEGRDTAQPERALAAPRAPPSSSAWCSTATRSPTWTRPRTTSGTGQLYNGRSCNLITSREGATVDSIEVLRDGVVSRGVLLDVARQRGVP